MKKTVLNFGLISGLLCALMEFAVVPFAGKIGFDRSMYVGYTILVLSFLLVFFGIRAYREDVGGGQITFARGFAVGILVSLITCVFYVAAWEIVYYWFMPDFWDKYGQFIVEKARTAGANAAAIQAKVDEISRVKQMYQNPVVVALMTFMEPFPVGLAITLLSAAILRKKARPSAAQIPATAI
jgi:hypothetical protein